MDAKIKLRLSWIKLYKQLEHAGKVCEHYGISRFTLRKWYKRYEVLGKNGLCDISSKPKNCFVDSSLSLDSKHDVDHIDKYDDQLSINFTENNQIKSGLLMNENDDINDNILTRGLSELSLQALSDGQFARITLANTCTVKLPRDLILTNNQQQNLEKAISTVYGYVKIVYQQLPATYTKLGSSRLSDEIFLTELDQNSVWYKIRKKLIANFGEHIDKSWFSKLRAEEDAITQKLTLIAPTNFLRDWINNKYGYVIKDIAKTLHYQFVELVTKQSV